MSNKSEKIESRMYRHFFNFVNQKSIHKLLICSITFE